ncbi:MAG: thiamine pyrophosphate-dependent enzyme [Patescibacteria group bacterium]|jgi:2-oxoglutarate ferredoxin oxidoreductase subunit beta
MNQTDRFLTPNVCNWCTGCGNFGIWYSFKKAAEAENWSDGNTVIVAGIGCHGHIINFTKITAFEGLHGRAIPVASGIKFANHNLNVMVFTGDGDCLSEGGNHFIHAARRNQNITVILHDNAIYGLTTGQTSSRSSKGYVSKSTPDGKIEEPLNPMMLALSAGATFVARSYAGDIEHTAELMARAAKHKGFALLDILQPCVTFNHEYTHIFYQKNTYKLDNKYKTNNLYSAMEKCSEWGEKNIPVGVFYESDAPCYEDQLEVLKNETLVKRSVPKRDISKIFDKYC